MQAFRRAVVAPLLLLAACEVSDAEPVWERAALTASTSDSAYRVEHRPRPEEGPFPCSDCHDDDAEEIDVRQRDLEDAHEEIRLDHGGGRFWCLQCHSTVNRDRLQSVGGQPIPFDRAEEVCADCHHPQYLDFTRGVHGKRLRSFEGERVIVACSHCHDPHAPVLIPRAPMPLHGDGEP